MALLAASRTTPTVSLTPPPDIISALHPLVTSAVYFQHFLSSLAFHLFVRTYFAASVVATLTLWMSKTIAWRTLLVSKFLAIRSLLLARRTTWSVWDCKRARRFRKRLEFELYILLVGGGNTVLLVVFWPGWIMLGVLGCGVWLLTG
ncbi:hypothetical protein B0J18DRAFT_71336 [Chaetomium sp. MPI-SDFR-AT-0129]|nr:hypothetical protein B0J18DRAFT_71336 [Chaetomium sp. MPI-SDFR-AT-0129]